MLARTAIRRRVCSVLNRAHFQTVLLDEGTMARIQLICTFVPLLVATSAFGQSAFGICRGVYTPIANSIVAKLPNCRFFLLLALMSSGEKLSYAASFDLPPATVEGSSALGGPSFVLPVALTPDDILRARISGTVDFDAGNSSDYSADWNAAGVVVRTRSTRLIAGGSDPTFVNQGWLRLSLGNDSLGYFPLLETNAANGFGSLTPPEDLFLSRTVGSVFGATMPAVIPAGATLQYRIVDSPTIDNSGRFVVSAVPEPASGVLANVMALVGIIIRRQMTSRR